MGDIFGKGSDTPSPPPQVSTGSDSESMAMIMEMMQSGMFSMPGIPAMPQMPAMPEIERTPEIDWAEKQETLATSMSAKNATSNARKHGRTDTIHTSPLLDEEEPNTTESILTGS